MLIPDRRTLVVLSSLIGAMTVGSSLLMLLEPGPATTLQRISLLSVDRTSQATGDGLFNTIQDTGSGRWSAVVIRYGPNLLAAGPSAIEAGQSGPSDRMAYHFLVRPGEGRWDDQVQLGHRWRHQQAGAYWVGPESDWVNHHAIGICVESDDTGPAHGQLRKLIRLVQRLQARFQIPADRVILQLDSQHVSTGARWFPESWFRQQLLTFAAP